MFPYNGWNYLRTCFCPALRRKNFCFQESWHNPLEEISNIKNASLYCNSFSFSCSYSAPLKFFCLQFPILHFSPSDISYTHIIVQLLLLANMETSQYTDWYGIKPHIFLPHGPQHMTFGCLSKMLCIVAFYSTPK